MATINLPLSGGDSWGNAFQVHEEPGAWQDAPDWPDTERGTLWVQQLSHVIEWGFLRFNAEAMPAGAPITAAKLHIYARWMDLDLAVGAPQVRASNWTPPLSGADLTNFGDVAGTIPYSGYIEEQWIEIELDPAKLSVESDHIGLALVGDIDNFDENTDYVDLNFTVHTAEYSSPTLVPYLELEFDESAAELTITTNTVPGGEAGLAYSQSVQTFGGTPPYLFSVTAGSLPPGLSLNSSTGLISGVPTTPGSYVFTVTVTDDDDGEDSKEFTLNVVPQPAAKLIACGYDNTGTVANAQPHMFYSEDGITWTEINYPAGWQGQTPAEQPRAVAYSPALSMFVCFTRSYSGYSYNGRDWFSVAIPAEVAGSDYPRACVWFPGIAAFVALGGDYALVSADGVTWQAHELPAGPNNWASLTCNNTVLVAVQEETTATKDQGVMTSHDGRTWTRGVFPPNPYNTERPWSQVRWNHQLQHFIATSFMRLLEPTQVGMFAASPNGKDWFNLSVQEGEWFGLAVNHITGRTVATATGTPTGAPGLSRAMLSENGVGWSLVGMPAAHQWISATYSQDLDSFFAVSLNNTGALIAASAVGESWSTVEGPIPGVRLREVFGIQDIPEDNGGVGPPPGSDEDVVRVFVRAPLDMNDHRIVSGVATGEQDAPIFLTGAVSLQDLEPDSDFITQLVERLTTEGYNPPGGN